MGVALDIENLKHCLWIDEKYDKIDTVITTNSDKVTSSYIDCTINKLEDRIVQIEETLQKTSKRKRRIKKVRITL